MIPGKLTRDQVIAKYKPLRDPLWTSQVEAEFFAGLPKARYRDLTPSSKVRDMLVRDYGKASLEAQRMSQGYVLTLGATLGRFAEADQIGDECLIARRDEGLGTPDTVRTIQAQMLATGLMVKATRPQGHGFVGDVFVYSPNPPHRFRKATEAYMEQSRRVTEGECPCPSSPSNLSPEDIPF